jgi:hypothetical protein
VYTTFTDITRLEVAAQRSLLQSGEAVERVWAAWALGLELGAQIAPDLAASLQDAPEPGLRRHLIVMLAGLGEKDILFQFAQADPDAYVRATACQYVIRTCDASDSDVQSFLLGRLFHDESGVVRWAILRFAQPNLPSLKLQHLAELVGDPDSNVRDLAASLFVARCAHPGASEALLQLGHLLSHASALHIAEILLVHCQPVLWGLLQELYNRTDGSGRSAIVSLLRSHLAMLEAERYAQEDNGYTYDPAWLNVTRDHLSRLASDSN